MTHTSTFHGLLFVAGFMTLVPILAHAQNNAGNVIRNANPDAWRRNDGYMQQGNDRRSDNNRSNTYYNNNHDRDNEYGHRQRRGNGRVVNDTSHSNSNNGNTSLSNGVTINNIYSVPTTASSNNGNTATNNGNASVNRP